MNDEASQPNTQTVIRVQQEEIARLSDNRVYLMALLQDTRQEAIGELAARDSHIMSLEQQLEESHLFGLDSQLEEGSEK